MATVKKSRSLYNVIVRVDTPAKYLTLAELVKSVMVAYNGKTRNGPYGNSFKQSAKNIKKVLDDLDSLYALYNTQTADSCLWHKNFKVFNIKDDLCPVFSEKKEDKPKTADMSVLIKLLCAQLRLVSNKQLVTSGRTIGQEHYDIQECLDAVVKNVLKDQESSVDNNGQNRIVEPLVNEFYEAHKTARSTQSENKTN